MSKNILMTQIETELEKIKNLLSSGELNDVRRARMANHGEELAELLKQLKHETVEDSEIGERFHDLKESIKSI